MAWFPLQGWIYFRLFNSSLNSHCQRWFWTVVHLPYWEYPWLHFRSYGKWADCIPTYWWHFWMFRNANGLIPMGDPMLHRPYFSPTRVFLNTLSCCVCWCERLNNTYCHWIIFLLINGAIYFVLWLNSHSLSSIFKAKKLGHVCLSGTKLFYFIIANLIVNS